MNCEYCGATIPPNATNCPSCGATITQPVVASQAVSPAFQPQNLSGQPVNIPQIPNHLVGAILTTVFCCIPFGIVAIINAANVNSKLAAGDVNGAKMASEKANTWMKVAFWVGLIVNILVVVAGILGEE